MTRNLKVAATELCEPDDLSSEALAKEEALFMQKLTGRSLG
jgi:hypothetical protein